MRPRLENGGEGKKFRKFGRDERIRKRDAVSVEAIII